MNHDTRHSGHGRHGLLMLLCCLVPLIILGLVYGLGLPLGGIGRTALILICPLSHILMMVFMRDPARRTGHEGTAHEGHHLPEATTYRTES